MGKIQVVSSTSDQSGRKRRYTKNSDSVRANWQIFNYPLLINNYWVSMENQLSSSGIFSQKLHHYRFFRRSRVICENGILNLKMLEIGLSLYLFSAPLTGQEKETKRSVFQIQKKTRCTRRDSRKDIGHFLALETKSNGMETAVTRLKENDIPSLQRWYSDSRKQVTGSLRASQG